MHVDGAGKSLFSGMKSTIFSALLVCLILFSGCGKEDDPGIDEQHIILFQEMNRFISLHIPDGYTGEDPLPLLIAYHGAGDNGSNFKLGAGFDKQADQHGFIVAYPSASGSNWAEGCNCIRPDLDGIDDLGFTDEVISLVDEKYNIDRGRVYASGYSQGGFFVHRLACERASRFAGVATVGSLISEPMAQICNPSRPMDFLMMNGTADGSVPFTGIQGGLESARGAFETMLTWKDINSCPESLQSETVRSGNRTSFVHSIEPCDEGTRVRLHEIQDGPHEWPRGNIDAPSLIVSFFRLDQ